MSPPEVSAFASRLRAVIADDPPSTTAATRSWLVEPLLEALGWSVRDADCTPDVTVDGVRLEYLLAVESVPAAFVAVERFDDGLDADRAEALTDLLARTHVDRAIYTDGRRLALFAGTAAPERTDLDLATVDDRPTALADYHRKSIERTLADRPALALARRLAVERDAVSADVLTALTDAAGDEYAPTLELIVERFVDRLLEAIVADVTADSSAEIDAGPEEVTTDRDEDATTGGAEDATTDRDEDAARGGDERDEEGADGEYVVRFFDDRGSVGAIGHSSSALALVHAAEYLFERGLSGIERPWRGDDGEPIVVDDVPERGDERAMRRPRALSNGLYLETAGDAGTHAERVEALAERAGLRAMLTGDWG